MQNTNFGDARGETHITHIDLEPPRPLSIAARQVFDRHAKRIHAEGRWSQVDHDLLCLFVGTERYLRFKKDIDDRGSLLQGRTLQEKVRNPSLMGLSQADLIRLAKKASLRLKHTQTVTAHSLTPSLMTCSPRERRLDI